MRGKTIVFIDNSNIFHGSKAAGWRIDAKALVELIEDRGEVWQVFFFAAVTDPPRYQQTSFYRFLKNDLHFETTILPLGQKTTTCRHCGRAHTTYVEKGVDVALATKMLTLANSNTFETAVLVSGDKDYLETVKAIKAQGKRVEIYSWRGALSNELRSESSDDVVFLDDVRHRIELTEVTDQEAARLENPEEDSGEQPG